jgi:hypothetical protein
MLLVAGFISAITRGSGVINVAIRKPPFFLLRCYRSSSTLLNPSPA